ncbi:MAG: PaaI family thioesterase [Flavobacteriaceae bacterium]
MAERRIGTIGPEILREMDGLSQLRGVASGELPSPPIGRVFNFGLAEVEKGRAVFTGTPTADHLNPLGTVHGGWAATLLDSALACAVHSTLEKGEGYTTVEFKVNLVRPITPQTGKVTCTGTVINRGRQIATSEARLEDAGGKLLAHGVETCIIMPLK